jgi:hypothetical protein
VDAGLIAVALVGFYLLPSIIAFCREHDRTSSIIVLNFLIGWTLLGWVLALAWACTQTIPRHIPRRSIANTSRSPPPGFISAVAAIFVVVGALVVLGTTWHEVSRVFYATASTSEPTRWCQLELKKPEPRRAERAAGLCASVAARP